jgi:hypothetical protein
MLVGQSSGERQYNGYVVSLLKCISGWFNRQTIFSEEFIKFYALYGAVLICIAFPNVVLLIETNSPVIESIVTVDGSPITYEKRLIISSMLLVYYMLQITILIFITCIFLSIIMACAIVVEESMIARLFKPREVETTVAEVNVK